MSGARTDAATQHLQLEFTLERAKQAFRTFGTLKRELQPHGSVSTASPFLHPVRMQFRQIAGKIEPCTTPINSEH